MDEKKLQKELQSKVSLKLMPLFERYRFDYSDLESVLKWKPIVLVIGNYSSGKSTLINELIGRNLQRTGQAPTDDSFTIITSYGEENGKEIVPGSTLVNDETLPFVHFKSFGEQFMAHFRLKKVNEPFLENMAIIDSPGMIDAVTEKDRGYDYLTVLGEFAKLADLVVLMFDPHKAGTISETYTTIRSTLPETSGEDRIVFVMSRIDECDNFSDLVRSYGTLCWNLSQMTGRKDIPRIFVTYAEGEAEPTGMLAAWSEERKLLKKRIFSAPEFRVYHILQDIDRQVNELQLICEAMHSFSNKGRKLLSKVGKFSLIAGLAAFFIVDVVSSSITGVPEEPLLAALVSGSASLQHLTLPLTSVALVCFLTWIFFTRWSFPRLVKDCRAHMADLVVLDTNYKKSLWDKVAGKVSELLSGAKVTELGGVHGRNLSKTRRFLDRDLQDYYDRIR